MNTLAIESLYKYLDVGLNSSAENPADSDQRLLASKLGLWFGAKLIGGRCTEFEVGEQNPTQQAFNRMFEEHPELHPLFSIAASGRVELGPLNDDEREAVLEVLRKTLRPKIFISKRSR